MIFETEVTKDGDLWRAKDLETGVTAYGTTALEAWKALGIEMDAAGAL